MPGYIKIGKTTTTVEQRMHELDNTGVPLPFRCYYAAIVPDCHFLEKKLHDIFGVDRVRLSREFFQTDPSRIKKIIELVAIVDITPKIESCLSNDDAQSLEKNERRQSFRFSLAKITPGTTLCFMRKRDETCMVLDDKYVEFKEQKRTLSNAASQILQSLGWKSTSVQGPNFWTCENDEESLDERRRRLETENS